MDAIGQTARDGVIERFSGTAWMDREFGAWEQAYWDWYQRLWSYCWRHFVDHQYGAWFRILDRRNRKYSDEKSPAGKTDYHTMGACYEALRVIAKEIPA